MTATQLEHFATQVSKVQLPHWADFPEMGLYADQVTVNNYPMAAYDRFVDLFNAALRNEEANKTTLDPAIEELLNLAVVTTIARLKTTALLAVLQEQLPPTKIK
ncbi:hypothetical protein OS909_09485 [Limosilactobacillus fermentum]|uniref:hypothetical protein n=1 Tax=Limosilactobacillus fermentum TaxID=1613 RepID=UPI0009731A33|nr:hypothetical protein [Limosilactobacillus fermentum]WNY96615.1 hypothetical protein OS909_09485 [Limosilactobacillus fermentum]BAW87611.1 hypothetical protein LF25067_01962 [Limosilactobacillus fermentum]